MLFYPPRRFLLILAAAATAGCSTRTTPPALPEMMPASYRVVEAETGRPIGFYELARRAAAADLVFFGEFHDDPGTHRLQRAFLEVVAQHRDRVVLAMEMFERDVQPVMDDYLAGRIGEAEFLAESRPWPNYPTDYRPLVEFAREQGWPVLAGNVPRRYAAQVARGGLDILQELPAEERRLIAREIDCPRDDYYDRFAATMRGHPGLDDAMIMRFYEAQCIKDETMAESIVDYLVAHPGTLVIHMNGSFHSDYGLGVPVRVLRRRPEIRVVTLTGIPVAEPENAPITDDRERADYLIFTKRPPAEIPR